MHRIFREALDDATGESLFVIVVFIDIRGFSAFSKTCESPNTAMFLKRVYTKLIDKYFDFASFYKSTGDGLLFIIPFGDKNLKEMCKKVITSCLACHLDFGNICNGDPMITFDVPDKIGIGVARDTACCLRSGEIIIDYSGRLLNLTSRLTQLARPSGIVIDGKFGIDLLPDEQRSTFKEANVYLDGIAEDEPIQVYFTKKFTRIPKRNLQPIASERWQHKIDVKPFRDLLGFGMFRYVLDSEPLSPDDIKVTVTHHRVVGGKVSQEYGKYYYPEDFTYSMEAGQPIVRINFPALVEAMKEEGVKKNMNVAIDIAYVEK